MQGGERGLQAEDFPVAPSKSPAVDACTGLLRQKVTLSWFRSRPRQRERNQQRTGPKL